MAENITKSPQNKTVINKIYIKMIFYILALVYALVGFTFLLIPIQLIDFINHCYSFLIEANVPGILALGIPSTLPSDGFYAVLTTAMMMMLSLCAFRTAQDLQNRILYQLHLLSKLTSVVGFLYYFARTYEIAYSVGAIVDGSIFLLVLFLYRRRS